MSFFARFSLANRSLVALGALIVAVFGLITVPALKQQLLPSLEFPAAFISAAYAGASPDIVEEQVTVPIETAIQGVPGLSGVTSTSREGFATVQVEFEFGTDLDDAVSKLQSALNRVDAQLPEGVDPSVFAGSTDDFPAIVLAAASPGDERAFAEQLERSTVPELKEIEGVREVAVTGARTRNVVITPDVAKLAAAKADASAIGNTLRVNGVAVPAGAVASGDKTLAVQVGTRIATLEDLRDLYLVPAGAPLPAPVRLGDVATVERQLAPATSLTRTNGTPSLGISITASPDGNAVAISEEVRDRLADLEKKLGGDAKLTVIFDQAPFVERSIEGLTTEGLLGLAMAVLVILVFLLSLRSTIVTAVSIPLSVLVALIALRFADYSLNLLTLGALTIAVGRVVDDSIVVLENIKRHLGYGEDKRDAILDGVREVSGAVVASTLTTVAVFAPIALVGGFVGQLFAPFAVTVAVALLASLLVSLTIIPVLAYWFLKPPKGDAEQVRRIAEEKELRSPLQRAYLPVIRFATKRRVATLAIGLLVLVGTFGLASRLETNFIDQSGEDTLAITQKLPIGTGLAGTDAAAKKVEGVLADTDGVKSYQATVGGGGGNPFAGGGAGANEATYSIALDEDADAGKVEADLRKKFDGMAGLGELTFGEGGGGSGFNADQLEIVVRAPDQDSLEKATEMVRAAMAGTPDVTDVKTSRSDNVPRVEVTVDRAAAARYGLSEQAIGQLVATAFRGSPLGQVTVDGEQQAVVLRLGTPPANVDGLKALPVPTPLGVRPLDDLADIREVARPVALTRIDGSSSVSVTGKATGSDVGATSTELQKRVDALDLPGGATFTVGGVSADQQEAFADLGMAVLAAIAIVFLIMVATFRSLVQPLVLLVSVPFAATGAIGLLLVTGTPLGVPALIGVLMLVGIVVTNAIVLMDLINQYRAQGMGIQEAVVEGGRRRLRPILMTAIATIFALVPMALGLTGGGGFISQPLAIVVIGGLLSSTLLTLVLVPTLYTMVENTKERLRRRRERRRATPVEEPAPRPDEVPVG
ncbi:hydrogenase expression protein [Virgisporangium aliadipatigenens]|uniref:Hydrogenase expression protein n=1 Tax=Virgisporangium aliadipatigenens TaxID=741659 RepID=A0A8J3YHZ5_9ACTN|nr:hydrogenase expression protein [Virgisporangium aliadipatigenens]